MRRLDFALGQSLDWLIEIAIVWEITLSGDPEYLLQMMVIVPKHVPDKPIQGYKVTVGEAHWAVLICRFVW